MGRIGRIGPIGRRRLKGRYTNLPIKGVCLGDRAYAEAKGSETRATGPNRETCRFAQSGRSVFRQDGLDGRAADVCGDLDRLFADARP